jgi:hypothetical protein
VHGYGCERGTKLEGLVKVPDKKKRQIDNQNSTNSSSKKANKGVVADNGGLWNNKMKIQIQI